MGLLISYFFCRADKIEAEPATAFILKMRHQQVSRLV